MSFAFGFTADDVSDDEFEAGPTAEIHNVEKTRTPEPTVPPQLHTLLSILSTLKDVRLTFDNYTTPGGHIVYRRELFDIKHQAMTEDEEEKEIHRILISSNLSDEVDLRKNVYEGGFKLWECLYDLVDQLDVLNKSGELAKHDSFMELGSGTSLPSCYLLMLLLQDGRKNKTLVLSDFNYEVLRLVTVPNLIIHWASTLDPKLLYSMMDPSVPLTNEELLLTPALLDYFVLLLAQKSIELSFISGAWGEDFCKIASPFKTDLVLSSETIYSLETLPVVLDVLLTLLAEKEHYLALVAAKYYYFGVGGSIKEFTDKLNERKPPSMQIDTIGDTKGQLKRAIVRLFRI